MNAATEFDVGPLTWVKSEIDLALGRADQALQLYSESLAVGDGDLTQVRFSRTHLHQVQGALTIVGLDGVTQFAEALEGMLQAIEEKTIAADPASLALARQALAMVGHYLDDLINGQPNQPLRLLTIYREIQAARGFDRISATDLFYPDLTARPPKREVSAKRVDPEEFHKLLRQERVRFQRGFLAWLRNSADRSGVGDMLAAVRRIEETQESGASRSFWWVASGFLSALAEGAVREEGNAKQLCARIDLQIRRLLDGSKNVAERLVRDALYFVATADTHSDAVQKVKDAYQLQAAVPSADANAPAPEEAVRRKLREVITSTEETWNKFCAGTMQVLPLFKEHASGLSTLVTQLGHTDFRRLAQAISAAANWLSEDSARHSDVLAMEIATAILLAQNAQESFQKLGGDFAHQVDITVARIHGCIAGSAPQPGSETPLLDEMSRRAQEKLLIGQVAKEIQSNLVQIEQMLDSFFRDATKRSELEGLGVPLRQVIGALSMMRQDAAVEVLRACSGEIDRFASPGYVPQEADFEKVADQLSMIGFFIDAMQHGADDFADFSNRMQNRLRGQGEESGEAGDVEPSGTVEQELEQQKLDARALLGALKEQPDDSGLREELKNNLTALRNDADLVADTALVEQTKAMLSALEIGSEAAPQLDEAMASLKPQQSDLPAPSAETIQLSQASTEEIDAELLGIFLEEANEVLATIGENAELLQGEKHNVEYLTTIRRSFHTLKGSGRMVGLKDVGEAAWAVEQTLNLWLRKELEVGASLMEMIELAYSVFSNWVRFLETREGNLPDPAPLIRLADSLRQFDEDGLAAPVVGTALSATAETSPEMTQAPALEVPSFIEIEAKEPLVPIEVEPVATHEGAEIINIDFSSPAIPSDAADEEWGDYPVVGEDENPVTPVSDESSEALPSPVMLDKPARAQQTVTISPVLYEIFSEEASGHLATLQKELSVLERNELLPTPHAMYRAAHTLAGISATVGMDPVNRLGLALEHALLRRDHSSQQASPESLAVISQSVGELGAMLETIAVKHLPEEARELIVALDGLYPAAKSPVQEVSASFIGVSGVEALPEGEAVRVTPQPEPSAPAAPVEVVPQVPDGPKEVGYAGLLQPIADAIKLLSKQLIVPAGVDGVLFRAAPILVVAPAMIGLAAIPFSDTLLARNLNLGLVMVFSFGSINVMAIMLAGWSSRNKYAVISAARVVSQNVAYEIPMLLVVISMLMITGTMNLTEIVRQQAGPFWHWNLFRFSANPLMPVTFLIFFTCLLAETNRAPFDMAEAESELVAGAITEYSGMGFGVFFMGEYANILLGCSVATVLFLGGWQSPFGFWNGLFWFLLKMYFLCFAVIWVRWTFPRTQFYGLLNLSWKILIPVSLLTLLLTSVMLKLFRV